MFNDIKATNKRIAKQIKSIAGRNKTLRNMIQSTLCEIAAHAYQHGDVTLYDRLLDAVRGQDRKALIDWIEEYGFARMRSDKGTFGSVSQSTKEAAGYADGQAVFDDYTAPDTTIKPWFDFVKSVKQIAKDMNVPQGLLAYMAQVALHDDPESDLKGKVRNNVVWGEPHELEHALAQIALIAQKSRGHINANVPPMAIAAE